MEDFVVVRCWGSWMHPHPRNSQAIFLTSFHTENGLKTDTIKEVIKFKGSTLI